MAVISEGPRRSPRPQDSLLEPAVSWVSAGDNVHKQIAVGSARLALTELEPREGQGQWAVAVRTPGGPDVLGIWSRPPVPGSAAYADSVISTLYAWADVLVGGSMIVAGDFNVGFPTAREGRYRNARRLARVWAELGLVSAYHHYFDVRMGDESRPTFFDERRQRLGWHIDYVLVHRDQLHRLRGVELGDYWEWVESGRSDHVPLIVDLNW